MLIQGLVRKIGDGNSTLVWSQNWIPRDFAMRPLACLGQNPPLLVSELIDTTTVSWRTDLLQRPMSDFWAWQFEKKGIFTVKSAYCMIADTKKRREDLLGGRASASNQLMEEKGWTSLWNTKIPLKIRTFSWRLARQSLPTEDVKKHRHMSVVDNCQLCGNNDSWKHSFIECSMARCVWALADEEIVEVMTETTEPSAKHWIFHV